MEATGLEAEYDKLSAELYELLTKYCEGEAGTIIRSLDECTGFTAWLAVKENSWEAIEPSRYYVAIIS